MRQCTRVATVVALGLAVLIGVPAFATAPPRGVPQTRMNCASKPAGCHAVHSGRSARRQSARERACGAAGGDWTCRQKAPIACYCGEP
jgi:hypothetical protein